MGPGELTIAVVVGVAALAFAMKMFARPPEERGSGESPARDSVEALLEEVSGGSPEIVAITSDGIAFVPDEGSVYLVPPGEPDDVLVQPKLGAETSFPITSETGVPFDPRAPVNPRTGRRLQGWILGQRLVHGDLIGARMVRGAPDYDPWRVEGLGRDRDYQAWAFETEDAARAALELIERHVVRTPDDENGDPRPPSSADYDEARRRDEETEHALDSEDEPA